MAKQTINNGESGKIVRDKLNDNFTELYLPQYQEYSDGTTKWRSGVRAGKYVRDKELTATGFDGTEDIDWENIFEEE